jgi:protein-S-isoprenylcysteine O-methyltransferase Ste14
MDSKYLPLLMMVLFLLIIIIGRIALQFILVGDSGVRSGTRLRTKKEMLISFLMFGVVGVQALLAWLYATSRLKPQLELGALPVGIGLALCVIGIAFSSYAQYKMGKEWRIGVDPGERTELVTTGIYKLIRNPIYTGCIVHGAGLIFLAPHLLFLVTGVIGYFAVRVYVKDIEEPYLIELHGDKFRQYMSQTGSFFPRLKNG